MARPYLIKFVFLLAIVLAMLPLSPVRANSSPTISRVSPSTPILFFVGTNQTFTAQVTDPDCDLQGSEWYVDHQYVGNTYYSGCSVTTSKWLGLSAGNHLVEANAFDTQGQYSASPAAWNVAVRYQVVTNHLADDPPYAYWTEHDSGPCQCLLGIYSYVNESSADAKTGKMLAGGGVSVGAGAGQAAITAWSLMPDEFKIVHDSLYQLSWSFDLRGVLLKEDLCVGPGSASVEASLDIDASLYEGGQVFWDSGEVRAYDFTEACAAAGGDPSTVVEIHPMMDPVTTPPLRLHQGVYAWQTTAKLFVLGRAYVSGWSHLEVYFIPVTLKTQYYDKWAKLTQFTIDDIYPDTVPPTTTCSPSETVGDNGWYKSAVSVTCNATDNSTPYGYGVNQTSYKVDNQQQWNNYTSPFTMESDGEHAFYFYSTDYANNKEDQQTGNVWIDTYAPVTQDNYDGSWHSSDFTVSLSATDEASGISETYYRLNDGSLMRVSVDGQPRITTNGANNKLEYWSVDKAGNEELPHNALDRIRLDKIPPIANAGQSQTVSVGTPVTLDGRGSSDNIGSVSYDWDFKDGTTGTGPTVTHSYANIGTYTVTLTVKDVAGNSATASTTVTVNMLPLSTGLLRITVYGADGDTILGATVTIVSAPSGQTFPSPVTTGADGTATFDSLFPGSYSYIVTANGYQSSQTVTVMVASGQTAASQASLSRTNPTAPEPPPPPIVAYAVAGVALAAVTIIGTLTLRRRQRPKTR